MSDRTALIGVNRQIVRDGQHVATHLPEPGCYPLQKPIKNSDGEWDATGLDPERGLMIGGVLMFPASPNKPYSHGADWEREETLIAYYRSMWERTRGGTAPSRTLAEWREMGMRQ